jgi:hypothetical protein
VNNLTNIGLVLSSSFLLSLICRLALYDVEWLLVFGDVALNCFLTSLRDTIVRFLFIGKRPLF